MDRQTSQVDVVVVGAGAAGLMAAIHAAERGKQVLLLEKMPRAGTKILMSGGTRCNITQDTDARGIVHAFGKPGRFLHSALAALGPDEVVDFFHRGGVPTKVEPGGKVFPVSDRADDVLQALLQRLRASGCRLALKEPVTTLQRHNGGFLIQTPRRRVACRRLILTTGGKSYPGSGTTGDGYAWSAELGHTIVAPRPALTPITTPDEWVRGLKGLTVPETGLEVVFENKALDARQGSLLFTHFGLSGPVALDISRTISGHVRPAELSLHVDLLPSLTTEALREQFSVAQQEQGKLTINKFLGQLLPKRLCQMILERTNTRQTQRLAEMGKSQRRSVIEAIKTTPIRIEGTRGFKKAEVTAGGVSLNEVDSKTMQSRVVDGLFIAGELLDLDGPIGGYNFQAAFSTGWVAGSNV